jgi:3-deoxy-D-manno-octulosonic-acid transferase
MINLYDIAYGVGVGIAAPYWVLRPSARRKVLGAFAQRMGRVPTRDLSKPAVMIHAVSVGEVNATRELTRLLKQARPELQFIISTTTTTGAERAKALYGNESDVTLIRYPLDFTGAVSRVLEALWPNVIVLMELEVWPNFMRQCVRRGIPVVLANGRITTPSFKKYRLLGPVSRTMFRRLTYVCAQDERYAARFYELGVRENRVAVAGTMKFDTAKVAEKVEGDAELAWAVGIMPDNEFVWVCGSTGPGEEEIVLKSYRELLARHGRMRLVIVPRKPERFDDVARLIEANGFGCVRRSDPGRPGPNNDPIPPVVLGDTMGELTKFYSMADVVFVGRTLVDLGPRQHGSDMMEPAALAKPIIVGPYTGNFASVVDKLRDADAILEAASGDALTQAIAVLHSTPTEAAAMGKRAQKVILENQGSTSKHANVVLNLLKLQTQAVASS